MTSLAKIDVILGPPGTGKTTTILARIDALLARGVAPEEIAFVSFTKAATTHAIARASERFQLDPERFPWFRTIHSMAYRAMADRVDVMTPADWRSFGESRAYSFSDGTGASLEGTLNYAEDGDALVSLDALARVMRTTIANAMLHEADNLPDHLTEDMVGTFRARLTEWKREHRKIDFTDMLEHALNVEWRPPVRFAFVDEAQDNSRIQNSLTRHWFLESSRCESLTYAGDDDQGIHGWAGAEKGDLLWLARKTKLLVLDQSYRIPRVVHHLSQRLIAQNKDRIAKTFRPRDDEGELHLVDSVERAIGTIRAAPTFVLVRNRAFATGARQACLDTGTLFSAEVGESSPLDRKDPRGAFAAISSWRRQANASAQEFRSLLSQIPSGKGTARILPLGVKARADRNTDAVPVWRARDEFKLDATLASVLGPHPFELLQKLTEHERHYLATLLARDPELAGPRVIITTKHRSKGREADNVIVLADLSYRTAKGREASAANWEAENCVAYVAVTRAKRALYLVRPSTPHAYDYERSVSGA